MLLNVWYEKYVLESQKLDLEQKRRFLHHSWHAPNPPTWIINYGFVQYNKHE